MSVKEGAERRRPVLFKEWNVFHWHSHAKKNQQLALLEKQVSCDAEAWNGALHFKRSTHWEKGTALAAMHSASQDFVVATTSIHACCS